MAPTAIATTNKVSDESSHQLDHEQDLDVRQTLKASRALLVHIRSKEKEKKATSTKRDLLATASDDDGSDGENAREGDDTPIWLLVSTKKHVTDKARLLPSKIRIPHSFLTSPDLRICLITADPQRPFKDAIDHPSFPADLRARISRVIGEDKIRKKYKSYESRRQLYSEHDVFLADDRVIVHLPHLLGKVFYRGGAKRPIPISIAGKKEKKDGRVIVRVKKGKEEAKSIAPPKVVADEITRTLSTALVHLAPSTSTAVKIGQANWDAEKVAENIEVAVLAMVEKFVPKKWRGLRAIHVKGPNTAALPIWLAEELWTDEQDVLEDVATDPSEETKAIEGPTGGTKKRKASNQDEKVKPNKKSKWSKARDDDHDTLTKEIMLRKEILKKQKAEAMADAEAEAEASVEKSKSKKPKAVPASA
ncbi:MAG: Ribosomal L1 domain-containing protein 1 [Sclerophora amabilis]|nr:MAG: Ribosomal L1 domain-containing protein 1 [Sclerophora amabilis]